MSHLTLKLLGPLQVLSDGKPVAFRTDKERALLFFLAVESDRPHRREALTGLLYPDQPQTQAQNNLRKVVFRLRTALAQDANTSDALLISPKTVQFNPALATSLDVQELQGLLDQIRGHK